MRVVFAFMICSLLAVTVPCAAQSPGRWKTVVVSGDSIAIDTRSIRKLDGVGRWQAWVRWIFPLGQNVPEAAPGAQKYYSTIRLYQFDCGAGRYRMKDEVMYYLDGTLAYNTVPPKEWPEWSNVVPESMGEQLQEGACAYLKRTVSR